MSNTATLGDLPPEVQKLIRNLRNEVRDYRRHRNTAREQVVSLARRVQELEDAHNAE